MKLLWSFYTASAESGLYFHPNLGPSNVRFRKKQTFVRIMIDIRLLLLFFLPMMVGVMPVFALAQNTETAKLVTEDALPLDAGST